MQLGISSYTYTWAVGVPGYLPQHPLSPRQLLDYARRAGLHVVQFCDNLPLHALSIAARHELARYATDTDIQIEVGTRGIDFEHLCIYLDIAQEFCSPILRVVIDTATHHPAPAEVVTLLGKVLPRCAQTGVTLAIENHDRFSTDKLISILCQLDDPHVGICLDTVNSFAALEGPATVIGALAPWTVNLHIKDFRITRVQSQMGFCVEGTPAGQGQLDIPGLLAVLQSYGKNPNAILEQWTPPELTVEATIAKEAQWADESIAYLRTLIPE